MRDETTIEEFKAQAINHMGQSLEKIRKSLIKLEEGEIWNRPNEASNSVGNLLLHLCGNIGQYVVSALGHTPDIRNRDAEFDATEGFSTKELIQRLEGVVAEATRIIGSATQEDLMKHYRVQAFEMSGIGIVIHVVEHLSYHTGQIAFWTKQLKNTDLGFYDGIDLNKRNED